MRLFAAIDAYPGALKAARRTGAAQSLLADVLGAALTVADGAPVAMSTATHAPVAAWALAVGVPELTEKPIALHAPDVNMPRRLAKQRGLPPMVGQSNRRQPTARAVRKLTASDRLSAAGSIGLRSNKARWNLSCEHSHAWRRHPLVLDMAILYFDLMPFTPRRESTAMSCDAEPSLEPVFQSRPTRT